MGLFNILFKKHFSKIIYFSIIGLIPALRDYNLFKNGIVKDGTIISLTPNSGLPITNIGQSILINYYYLSSSGQKIFGKSKTTDFSIMTEKKSEDIIKLFVSENDETKSCIIPCYTYFCNILGSLLYSDIISTTSLGIY